METRTDRRSRETRSDAGDMASGVWIALAALACPLFCLGPLLLAGLASTGLARVLHDAHWPLVAMAVPIVMALGIWGVRARGARGERDCCTPVPARPLRDGATR